MVENGLPTLLVRETVWVDAPRYEEAERQYYQFCARERTQENPSVVKPTSGGKPTSVVSPTSCGMSKSSLACEIAYARQKIQNFLKSGDMKTAYTDVSSLLGRIENLEKEKNEMNNQLRNLSSKYDGLLSKFSLMEKSLQDLSPEFKSKTSGKETVQNGSPDNEDDLDLFGSDEEDADAAKLKEERLKAYADKKAKKPALVAKSSVILDVKPWDDETDMKEMEKAVKEIKTDGLVWGASKLVPLAFGIKKLQIVAVVEDEKVSIDWLTETIQEIEDLVQSVDIAAFNKL